MIYNNFRGCPFTNTGAFLAEESPRIRNAIVAHKLLERDFFVGLARELAPAAEVPARALGDTLFLLYTGATTEAQNHRATWPIDRAQSCAQALFQRKDRIDEID